MYGDIGSSFESGFSLVIQALMDDTKTYAAPYCVDTSFLDDQFNDVMSTMLVATSKFRDVSAKSFSDSLQQGHLCLLDSIH